MKLFIIATLFLISWKTNAQDTVAYQSFEVKSNEKVLMQNRPYPDSQAVMITNGGMFYPDFKTMGMLVIGGKVVQPINTRTTKAQSNFYLQPNGVFAVSGGKYFVVPTKDFNKLYSKLGSIDFATQSGPVLVINGEINPIFDKQSLYATTRSGVGILPNGNPIFVVAKVVTFYDFAAIFRDKFRCQWALFLDGGISQMIENGSWADRNYGPMIEVVKK